MPNESSNSRADSKYLLLVRRFNECALGDSPIRIPVSFRARWTRCCHTGRSPSIPFSGITMLIVNHYTTLIFQSYHSSPSPPISALFPSSLCSFLYAPTSLS